VIFILNRQTVLMDVSRLLIERIASGFDIPPGLVTVTWKAEDGGIKPQVDIELPAPIPPSSLDVTNPEALAQWERECAELPGIMEFLKEKGVGDPNVLLKHHVAMALLDLRKRMEGLRRAAA